MRKFLMAIPLAAALTFGGCATTGTNIDIIAAVQAATVQACKFLPTAQTVADIFAAGNPLLVTASAVAVAICAAVSPQALAAKKRGGAAPTVAGVVVHGKFVR